MKLSACIEWLFADEEQDITQRIYRAADAGFYGVEFHLWRDKPIERIRRALDETGLVLTSFCVDPRRSIVDPNERDAFLEALRDSIEPAHQLGCQQMIIASGFLMEAVSAEEHYERALASLTEAAAMSSDNGITLLLEPLNTRVDHPGMYLDSVATGLDLVDAVNSPGLKLVYDAYHSSVMGDDFTVVLAGRMGSVAHIQIADMPGRGAPGTGAIDWQAVLAMLDAQGYSGAIGLEFKLNELTSQDAVRATRRALGLS
jgi:hydroxypyruvate isomerase